MNNLEKVNNYYKSGQIDKAYILFSKTCNGYTDTTKFTTSFQLIKNLIDLNGTNKTIEYYREGLMLELLCIIAEFGLSDNEYKLFMDSLK